MADKWRLWINRRGHVKGIAIVHRASNYALQLHCDLKDEIARREYLWRICEKLNASGKTALQEKS